MPSSTQYQPNDAYDLVATIANGQTTSNEIDLSGTDVCGFFMPAAFTGTALKITASPTAGGTFVPVYDGDGSELSLAVGTSRFVPIKNLAVVAGLRFIKLVSGSSEGAQRQIIIAARPI
jgi:hypothetical protein